MKLKIAVLGASSQVGSSLILYLTCFEKVQVTAFTRSSYARPVFDRLGIDHQVLAPDRPGGSQILKGFDAVVDFSVPQAEFWENKKLLGSHLKRTIASLDAGTPLISMSTQNAFGFKSSDVFIRERRTDWSSPYCSLKRYGERTAIRLGKQYEIPIFNLRLGQVHGFLQSVSHQFVEAVSFSESLTIMGRGADLVNTLFIQDLAAAIRCILERRVAPGTYSVLSLPQWSQDDLYDYYKTWCRASCRLEFIGHRPRRRVMEIVAARFAGGVNRYRGFLDVVILQRFPRMALKAKGMHRVRSFLGCAAVRDIELQRNLLGTPPLQILGDQDASVAQILERERIMEETWSHALGVGIPFSPYSCGS